MDKKIEDLIKDWSFEGINSVISKLEKSKENDNLVIELIQLIKNYEKMASDMIEKYKKDIKCMEQQLKEKRLSEEFEKNMYYVLREKYPYLLKQEYNGVGSLLPLIEYLEKSHEESFIDPLTRLNNRRFFDDRLIKDIDRVNSGKIPALSLAIYDVDNFKKINDLHGHLVGDRILVEIAQIAKEILPEKYNISRYGGEEFAIIMPDPIYNKPKEDSAIYNLENFRNTVEKKLVSNNHNMPEKVTITIGVADYKKGNSKDDLIKAADDALYSGKKNGKNQIVVKDDRLNKLSTPTKTKLTLLDKLKAVYKIMFS